MKSYSVLHSRRILPLGVQLCGWGYFPIYRSVQRQAHLWIYLIHLSKHHLGTTQIGTLPASKESSVMCFNCLMERSLKRGTAEHSVYDPLFTYSSENGAYFTISKVHLSAQTFTTSYQNYGEDMQYIKVAQGFQHITVTLMHTGKHIHRFSFWIMTINYDILIS